MTTLSPFAHMTAAVAEGSLSTERIVTAAQVLATTVRDSEFSSWCACELSGYPETAASIPEYRKVVCSLVADNGFRTGVPVMMENPEDAKLFGICPLTLSLGQLEEMAAVTEKGRMFAVAFKPDAEASLLQATPLAQRIYRTIQPVSLRPVIGAVRRRVYDWALPRIGEEVALPGGLQMQTLVPLPPVLMQEEPAALKTHSSAVRFDIQGSGNNVVLHSSHVRATATTSGIDAAALARDLVALLADPLAAIKSDEHAVSELREAVDQLRAVSALPKPKESWLRESAQTIKAIAENAAGSIAGTLMTPQAQALLVRLAGG